MKKNRKAVNDCQGSLTAFDRILNLGLRVVVEGKFNRRWAQTYLVGL